MGYQTRMGQREKGEGREEVGPTCSPTHLCFFLTVILFDHLVDLLSYRTRPRGREGGEHRDWRWKRGQSGDLGHKTRTFGSGDVTSPSFVRVWAVGLPARQDCEARPVHFHISLSTK